MERMASSYRACWSDKTFLRSAVAALCLLLLSIVFNVYAGFYATENGSNAVTDIVLSNIPVFNVGWFFIYGAILFWVFIAVLCVTRPERLPFILKTTALFVFVRSVFITLTHIGPFPTHIVIDPLAWHYATDLFGNHLFLAFFAGNDLFFSGHTGLPFLMALIFWDDRRLRVLFLVSSVVFGAIVLMGHLHYSIDVLAAFFITYAIFHLAEIFFKKDRALFQRGFSAAPSAGAEGAEGAFSAPRPER